MSSTAKKMASGELKHRKPDDSQPSAAAADGGATTTTTTNGTHNKAMAKRGLKSLALAISIPLSLTFSIFLLTNPQHHYPSSTKPFWVPSMKVVNVGSLATSLLMGVSAWLVWAEGGFHARPNTLYLYALYSVLCLAWYGLTFGAGARRLGLVACVGKTVALVRCDRLFRGVSRTAADLVKPCLVWSGFVTVVTLAMLSL